MPAGARKPVASGRRQSPQSLRIKSRTRRVGSRGQTRFVISQVLHRNQRYDTVGDWIPGEPVKIRVSKMKDERYVFLVALHEMIEYELCRMNGITDGEVVQFDTSFEKERRASLHTIDAEPGDDPRAPYREEHGFATMIERLVARKMGVSWSAYEKAVLSLAPQKRLSVKPMIGN
jgi:hypothetical protein